MEIYNENKTQKLNENALDLKRGYLKADKLFIAHHDAVEAVKPVYKDRVEKLSNGSTQVWKELITLGTEANEAYDEYKDIQVYVPYTEAEFAELEILQLKQRLSATDYQAIKYAEGEMSEVDYAPIKAQRAEWRRKINELEFNIVAHVDDEL